MALIFPHMACCLRLLPLFLVAPSWHSIDERLFQRQDKIEIRPKYVISFQFPDDTTKTIPCDYKMPINEALQFIFEDDACKRFAGLYLYDGGLTLFVVSLVSLFLKRKETATETRLDTSMSFIEQGLRYNATVFFRHTDVAPQRKKKQATLTNYVCIHILECIFDQTDVKLFYWYSP